MLNIPAGDARAMEIVSAIQSGDVATLQGLLSQDPALATARIVDGHGTARTLLHVAADWPGHFPNGPATVAALIAAGADVWDFVRRFSARADDMGYTALATRFRSLLARHGRPSGPRKAMGA